MMYNTRPTKNRMQPDSLQSTKFRREVRTKSSQIGGRKVITHSRSNPTKTQTQMQEEPIPPEDPLSILSHN